MELELEDLLFFIQKDLSNSYGYSSRCRAARRSRQPGRIDLGQCRGTTHTSTRHACGGPMCLGLADAPPYSCLVRPLLILGGACSSATSATLCFCDLRSLSGSFPATSLSSSRDGKPQAFPRLAPLNPHDLPSFFPSSLTLVIRLNFRHQNPPWGLAFLCHAKPAKVCHGRCQ